MKTYLECVPCFVKQSLYASRLVTDDEAIGELATVVDNGWDAPATILDKCSVIAHNMGAAVGDWPCALGGT